MAVWVAQILAFGLIANDRSPVSLQLMGEVCICRPAGRVAGAEWAEELHRLFNLSVCVSSLSLTSRPDSLLLVTLTCFT